MTQANQSIQRHDHITLNVGTAQDDYDFHCYVNLDPYYGGNDVARYPWSGKQSENCR